MDRRSGRMALLTALVALAGLASGCAYVKNRGNDLLDLVDVGITANRDVEPGFAAHLEITPLAGVGLSHVDGFMLGLGDRQAGLLYIREEGYGAIVWGLESVGIGRTAESAAAFGQPFADGLVRMVAEPEDIGPPHRWLDAAASLHLGWVGLYVRVKPFEALDFLAGLFTNRDIANDDLYSSPAAPANKAPEQGGPPAAAGGDRQPANN